MIKASITEEREFGSKAPSGREKIPVLGCDFDAVVDCVCSVYSVLLSTSHDWRKEAKNGIGSKRAMLLGDAKTMDQCDLNIEEIESCGIEGYRMRDERPANTRGAWVQAFIRGKSVNPRNVPHTLFQAYRGAGEQQGTAKRGLSTRFEQTKKSCSPAPRYSIL